MKDITRIEVKVMKTYNEPIAEGIELCEKCESKLKELAAYGQTSKEMFDTETQFHFDLAFILAGEGHYIVRASEKGKEYPKVIAIVETKGSYKENPQYEFAAVDKETDTILSYVTLSNQEILASDWTIAKLKEQGE